MKAKYVPRPDCRYYSYVPLFIKLTNAFILKSKPDRFVFELGCDGFSNELISSINVTAQGQISI